MSSYHRLPTGLSAETRYLAHHPTLAQLERQKEAATMADAATPEQLAELFKAFDPTDSGTLTAEGLQAVMRTQ